MIRIGTIVHGVLLLGLAAGAGGCGNPHDKDMPPLSEAQKAERAAQAKETEEAFKNFEKTKKKEETQQKSGGAVNGVKTS